MPEPTPQLPPLGGLRRLDGPARASAPRPFAGRDSEFDAFDRALSSRESLIVVSGEAGIGKTRFVAEVARQRQELGWLAVSGNCLPLSNPLPLLPVSQVLRALHSCEGGTPWANALRDAPPYVVMELARLLPELAAPAPLAEPSQTGGQWEQARLFAAIGHLVRRFGEASRLILIIEDLHWVDQATLDLLTYLQTWIADSAVTLTVTYRDGIRLPEWLTQWLLNARRTAPADLRLAGLTLDATAELVHDVLTHPLSVERVRALHSRTGGNPLFVEQLLAAGSLDDASGRLPQRLSDLLGERIRQVSDDARVVLSVLSVTGRPISEDLLLAMCDLDRATVRGALRELTAANLVAPGSPSGDHAPRHALLAEASLLGLLASELRDLHERAGHVLEETGDLAAMPEAAWHFQLARRPLDELRATIAAGTAASAVFAYREAAHFGERAIALYEQLPDAAEILKIAPLAVYRQAIESVDASGRGEDAAALAERAFDRLAGVGDPQTAAELRSVVGYHRRMSDVTAAGAALDEAIALFDLLPASAEQAMALLNKGRLLGRSGDFAGAVEPLRRALEAALAVGASEVAVVALANAALAEFTAGVVSHGFDLIDRGRAVVAELISSGADLGPVVPFSLIESDAYLKAGRLEEAESTALEGFAVALRCGRADTIQARLILGNAVEALLEQGKPGRAMRAVAPYTQEVPSERNWALLSSRAAIEVRLGRLDEARLRMREVVDVMGSPTVGMAREIAQDFAEVAVWGGRPMDVGPVVARTAERCAGTDDEVYWSELLVLGAQAAADMAVTARARSDAVALEDAMDALAAVEGLAVRMNDRPFVDHEFVVRIPADRAQWTAERRRARGVDDPSAWARCAELWQDLGRPHRSAYAWWRYAESLLMGGVAARDAAEPLRRAAALAVEMEPLLAEVRALAIRARISLPEPPVVGSTAVSGLGTSQRHGRPESSAPVVVGADAYGLTAREHAVLCLLGRGRTNAQIAAELFISPKTASVHVTNILRKLKVANRTQAAAVAERAGLLTDRR